jgi:hypothetical protein
MTTIFGTISSWIIKIFTHIERPNILIEQDFSFPSSHATASTIFLISGIFLISPFIKNKFSKNIFLIVISIIFPLVIFSRLYSFSTLALRYYSRNHFRLIILCFFQKSMLFNKDNSVYKT